MAYLELAELRFFIGGRHRAASLFKIDAQQEHAS
jgi:hypothetical protein